MSKSSVSGINRSRVEASGKDSWGWDSAVEGVVIDPGPLISLKGDEMGEAQE